MGGADSTNCNGAAGGPGVACHTAVCGDGYVDAAAGETCDTLGGADTVNCNGKNAPAGVACHAAICGDGYTNLAAGETCDNLGGADTNACNGIAAGLGVRCTVVKCGDGYMNGTAGETCEVQPDGLDTANCNGAGAGAVRCQKVKCGDGYINKTASEDCEVGSNGLDTATCNGAAASAVGLQCQHASCGDGYINGAAGEACDVVGGGDSSGCNGTAAGLALQCKKPSCGDGYLNTSAQRGLRRQEHGVGRRVQLAGVPDRDRLRLSDAGPALPLDLRRRAEAGERGVRRLQFRRVRDVQRDLHPGAAGYSRDRHDLGGAGVEHESTARPSRSRTALHGSVTFEFNDNTPTDSTHVQIRGSSTTNQMAAKIAAAINGVGAGLAINAQVNSSNKSQVQLTNGNPGSQGVVDTSETIGNFRVSKMLGGVGFDCPAGDGLRRERRLPERRLLSRHCRHHRVSLSDSGVTCSSEQLPGRDLHRQRHQRQGDRPGLRWRHLPQVHAGQTCIAAGDCTSGVCTQSICAAASCSDHIKNGAETDVDCGGGCPACADGLNCSVTSDCGRPAPASRGSALRPAATTCRTATRPRRIAAAESVRPAPMGSHAC